MDFLNFANFLYLILTFVLITMGIYLYYLRLYKHPIFLKLSATPNALFTIPLERLPEIKKLLQWTHQLSYILNENNIPEEWLDNAIGFISMSPVEQCRSLCYRLNAQFELTEHNDAFKIQLNMSFPLNLVNFIIYFPEKKLAIPDIQLKLDFLKIYMQDVIIISFNLESQAILRQFAENRATPWVVPNNREITSLLLKPQPTNVFVALLTEQLTITRLSPYITAGANTKFFFGRETILAKIIQFPRNYFIVGGRQLGKSSLLKQIEHYYQTQQRTKCYYFSLYNTKLLTALGEFLGLDAKTSGAIGLSGLLNRLATNDGKRYLFLIDEADEFIHEEILQNYPNLGYFRGLSEQGLCHFIFAGFWKLYAATIYYHSPIRNFGETICIGELEYQACRQLAKKPMEMFRINFASERLIDMILQQTGQRANLIAITCDKLLKTLDNNQFTFYESNVRMALKSEEIKRTLSGWTQLTEDDTANKLDRIIVYATVAKGKFTQTEIMQFLDRYHYNYTTEQLQQSLERLVLAFIIQRLNQNYNHYQFCVPLFREHLLSQGKGEIIHLLKKEMFQKSPD